MEKQRGQSMVEYGLMIALISIALISAITLLGGNLNNTFSLINFNSGTEPEEENESSIPSDDYIELFIKVEKGESILYINENKDGKEKNYFSFVTDQGFRIIEELKARSIPIEERSTYTVSIQYYEEKDSMAVFYNGNKTYEKSNLRNYIKESIQDTGSDLNKFLQNYQR